MTADKAVRTRLGGDFQRLWLASSVSSIGNGVRLAALPLLTAAVSPTPGAVGVVATAGTLPWLLFSLVGGAIADRFDRRRLMWVTDAIRAAVMTGFTVYVLLATPPLVVIVVLAFLLCCAETIFDNAAVSLLPEVVAQDQLETANGRLQGAQLVGLTFIGPPVGAALFGVALGAPFIVDAVSFAVAALIVGTMRRRSAPAQHDGRSLLGSIGEGVRWLWRNNGLRLLAVQFGLVNMASQLGMTVLVLLVLQELHSSSLMYGLLLVCGAVGGVLASVCVRPLLRWLGMTGVLVLALGLIGVSMILTAVTYSIAFAAAMYFVAGFGIVVWTVEVTSIRQKLVPNSLMGRVSSAYRLMSRGGAVLGAALGGVLGTLYGVRAPFVVGGVIVLVSLVFVPKVARLSAAD